MVMFILYYLYSNTRFSMSTCLSLFCRTAITNLSFYQYHGRMFFICLCCFNGLSNFL